MTEIGVKKIAEAGSKGLGRGITGEYGRQQEAQIQGEGVAQEGIWGLSPTRRKAKGQGEEGN